MTIETGKTQVVRLDQMNPAKYNPRKDLQPGDPEFEKLRRSLKRFGYLDKIIWNERTGNIVGGHQRYKVMADEGVEEAEVTVVDLDTNDEKALNVGLNKISGDWDEGLLAELLNELAQEGYDTTLTGFEAEEVDSFLDNYQDDHEPIEDDDYDPEEEAELIVEPYTKKGDLWCMGEHRIYCGDSLNAEHVTAAADGKTMDMVMTDPPYNVNYSNEKGQKIDNDHMADKAFYEFLLEAYKRMLEVTKEGGPIYVFHADSEGINFRTALRDSGWSLRQTLIWVKHSLMMGRSDYQWKHEPILYGWKPGAGHFWNGERDKTTVYDEDVDIRKMDRGELIKLVDEMRNADLTTVLRYNKPDKSELHPTMKPVPMIAQLIRNSSIRDHRVWDSFMGSGTTMIAAEKTGRVAHGLEFSEVYMQVIVERYIHHKGNDGQDVYVIRDGEKMDYAEAATTGYTEVK